MRFMVTKTLVIFCVVYLIVCTLTFLFQRKLIFIPRPGPVSNPEQIGLKAEQVEIPVGTSITLSAWWAHEGDSPYTLIWCHGNAGNLDNCADEFNDFIRAGINMLVFDYRGYGDSTGKPTAKGIKEDAIAVHDFLVSRGVKPETIVPYGRSIGSGAASFMANQRAVAGLILVQPLTSTLDMGRKTYPFLPIRFLLTERLDNSAELARFELPLLIIHGDCDDIVPYSMGQELYRDAITKDKKMITLEGGDHNYIGDTHGKEIVNAVREWLDHLSP